MEAGAVKAPNIGRECTGKCKKRNRGFEVIEGLDACGSTKKDGIKMRHSDADFPGCLTESFWRPLLGEGQKTLFSIGKRDGKKKGGGRKQQN